MTIKYRLISTAITLTGILTLSAQQVGGSSISVRTYTSADTTRNGDTLRYVEEKVFDNGLGDIIQEQKLGYSADTGTAIVTHHDYDSYRRETSVWLPTAIQTGGSYVPRNTLATAAMSFYGDQKPYSRTTYDEYWPAFPSSTTIAGSTWHDGNHSRHINSTISSITGLGLLPGSSTICLLNNQKFYSETVTDEDGCTRTTYKDEGGRVRMEETAAGRTYYVYDTRTGNLRFVLPPAASSYVLDKAYYTSYSEIDGYAYEYRYDGLNRCIYKALPGCAPIYYIYDRAGNLILTQDGNLRQTGKWMFSIPDRFGRPCLTGTCQGTYDYTDEPLKGVHVYAEYDGSSTYKGYGINGITLMLASVLTVTYYDTYDFVGRYEMPAAFSTVVQQGADTQNGRGLQTGGIEAYLDATGILGYNYSVIYYNGKKEAVRTGSTNHLGGQSITDNTYSFNSKVLTTETTTQIGSKTYNEEYTYEYDNADRLIRTRHRYGNSSEKTLSENTYDDLGHLSTVKRLDSISLTTLIGYNMHSQLKAVRTGTLFEEILRYEDVSNGNTPLYSGAISGIEWKSRNDRIRAYNYIYDQAKRLVSASYLDAAGNNGAFSTSYSYDSMGNITSLVRYGKQSSSTYGKIDSLTYTYNGNQLTAISDNAPAPTISGSFDFKDGANTSAEYLYDANGNMTKDANKGITQILYNHLNLPSRITMVKGSITSTIDYVYSASGAKQRVIHRPNVLIPLSTTTDYVNGYIFTNNNLSMALTDNGYYTFSNTGDSTYYFYLKDHQGNNRVVVAENDSIVQTNHYYPYGALFAESTNGDVQRFKYNGKELDRKFGLNWYDHGARHNDAAIGRWHSMDPMAEKYYGISPYAYCGGNPVNLGDYNGMDTLNFILKDGASDYASFSSRVTTNGNHIGIIKDSKGNVINQFSFINQEDAEMFKEEDDGGIALISKSEIESILSNIPDNLSLSSALEYAFKEGKNGTMDFMSQGNGSIQKKLKDMGKITLFLPQDGSNLAHDCWNYGNYLWGAGMQSRLHVPYLIAAAGAHYNNWRFPNIEEPGHLDSIDDQYSIALGYNSGSKNLSAVMTGFSYGMAMNVALIVEIAKINLQIMRIIQK